MKSKRVMGVAMGVVLLSTLGLSLSAHAQAINAVSNPPQQVYADPQPSGLDPDYPGERVALHAHLGHHHAVSTSRENATDQDAQHGS